MTSVGIIGASGFTGAELLRLCASHPSFDVRVATADSQAGVALAELYPSLAGAYGDQAFVATSPEAVDGLDLVFLGLPHGASQALVPSLFGRVGAIVDLAADFRLVDASLYPELVRRGAHLPRADRRRSPTGCPSCSGPTSSGRRPSPHPAAT